MASKNNKQSGIKTKYQIVDGECVIPEGTVKIESGAFTNCEELTSVILPESKNALSRTHFWAART